MEKENKKQPGHGKTAAPVVSSCVAESCKKKSERLEFCQEHFLWFKAGLVKKDGSYPKDFDKKYVQFMRKAG